MKRLLCAFLGILFSIPLFCIPVSAQSLETDNELPYKIASVSIVPSNKVFSIITPRTTLWLHYTEKRIYESMDSIEYEDYVTKYLNSGDGYYYYSGYIYATEIHPNATGGYIVTFEGDLSTHVPDPT